MAVLITVEGAVQRHEAASVSILTALFRFLRTCLIRLHRGVGTVSRL